MTTIAEGVTPVPAPPRWTITVDLTPPEILAARRARGVQRLVVLLLTALVLLCLLVYGIARLHESSASSDLKAENARTAQLQAKQRSFNGLIALKGKIAAVQTQLATLLATDVDLQKVLSEVQVAARAGTAINQASLTLQDSANPTAGGSPASDTGASSLDTGPHAHIGTLTLSGIAKQDKDVATYLDSLTAIAGVVEPYPGPISVSSAGAQFSITMTLNNSLLTHRYDVKNGK